MHKYKNTIIKILLKSVIIYFTASGPQTDKVTSGCGAQLYIDESKTGVQSEEGKPT